MSAMSEIDRDERSEESAKVVNFKKYLLDHRLLHAQPDGRSDPGARRAREWQTAAS